MTPKEFIQQVLINEVGEIHLNYPYISFATMEIGIEFLGKCLNSHEDWNHYASGVPKQDFERAINQLNSFSTYRPYLTSHNLWDALRNGFSHSFVPKNTLTLSSKLVEMAHLVTHGNKVNLKCEDFYNDFKSACEEVIAMTTFSSNKMNLPLLQVPTINPNNTTNLIGSTINYSGSTMP